MAKRQPSLLLHQERSENAAGLPSFHAMRQAPQTSDELIYEKPTLLTTLA